MEQAMDPNYWGRHLRGTMRFAAGIAELLTDQQRVFLEVGPQSNLSMLARQHQSGQHLVLPSLGLAQSQQTDCSVLLHALGRLWLAGTEINWTAFWGQEHRRRVPLPSYPFERQRYYWVEPAKSLSLPRTPSISLGNGSANKTMAGGRSAASAGSVASAPAWPANDDGDGTQKRNHRLHTTRLVQRSFRIECWAVKRLDYVHGDGI